VSNRQKGRLDRVTLPVIVNEPRQMDCCRALKDKAGSCGSGRSVPIGCRKTTLVILLSLPADGVGPPTNAAYLLRAARWDIPREDEPLPPPVGD